MQYSIDEDLLDCDDVGLFSKLHQRFAERALRVFVGRTRNVFDMGAYVVKLPKNFYGVTDNDWEGSVSSIVECPDKIQYPRTRLVYWREVPVVFAEFVDHASDAAIIERLGEVPDWVLCVDCCQVGFTKCGRLVAYDYGLH